MKLIGSNLNTLKTNNFNVHGRQLNINKLVINKIKNNEVETI